MVASSVRPVTSSVRMEYESGPEWEVHGAVEDSYIFGLRAMAAAPRSAIWLWLETYHQQEIDNFQRVIRLSNGNCTSALRPRKEFRMLDSKGPSICKMDVEGLKRSCGMQSLKLLDGHVAILDVRPTGINGKPNTPANKRGSVVYHGRSSSYDEAGQQSNQQAASSMRGGEP